MDSVVYFTITDPVRAVYRVTSYSQAMANLAQTTLRTVVGESELNALFSSREQLNTKIKTTIEALAAVWGIRVDQVALRDLSIPNPSTQRAMAQIPEARREAESKVIVAQGQRDAAELFREAAEIIGREPGSLQLQWFETLRQIAADKNSTVVVPDFLAGVGRMVSGAAGVGQGR